MLKNLVSTSLNPMDITIVTMLVELSRKRKIPRLARKLFNKKSVNNEATRKLNMICTWMPNMTHKQRH